MKHVLISGASGLLGAALLTKLADQGYTITALARSPLRSSVRGVQTISLDLATEQGWNKLPSDVDAVIHCSAYIPDDFSAIQEADRLWQINGLGTLRLLQWAQQHGVTTFIHCSSYALYQRPLPLPVPETHPLYPTGHATPYAVSKLAAELFVSAMEQHGIQTCSLRLSSLYGAGMKPTGVLPRFIALAKAKKPIIVTAHPQSLFDFLYVEDAATAICQCLTTALPHKIYNIGAGQGVTLVEVAEACWHVFAEATAPLIHCQAELTVPAYSVLDIARAQKDLGYTPAFTIVSGLQQINKHEMRNE